MQWATVGLLAVTLTVVGFTKTAAHHPTHLPEMCAFAGLAGTGTALPARAVPSPGPPRPVTGVDHVIATIIRTTRTIHGYARLQPPVPSQP